ncbi:putative reverse transcriptase domain-containing protein [Tanacetum coccineum]|uniref:Reverse transcriptase domain-containing protein n=1 Tax=Tanacetum coccineum TaxID=301880 RepID=A0ABQ5DZY5_9ASTR
MEPLRLRLCLLGLTNTPSFLINRVCKPYLEEFVRVSIDDILLVTTDVLSRTSQRLLNPLNSLTQKNQKYQWGEKQEKAFQTLKDSLCNDLILLLPDRIKDFGGCYGASNRGLRCILMQRGRRGGIISTSLVLWAEIGESSLIGPELVQETTDKVVLIKEKLKAARDRQKSCADNRRKQLEFG